MTRKRGLGRLVFLLVALPVGFVLGDIGNLAFDATISASGRLSEDYYPGFVADGMIPRRGSRSDVRKAWCLPQANSKDAWVSFAWKEPVEVASIVYWGRTAWMDTENFSACRVYIDGAENAAASALLQKGAQAQMIKLDRKHAAREVRLVFPGNFGGPNPGASEIGIFSGTPSDQELNQLSGKPVRISSNYLNDFTPSVLEDGRVIYSRWEYVDRPAIPIQSLWTINPDGTMLAGLFGNRTLSPGTFMDARDIPGSGGKILCVLTAHGGPCRGAIGIVDPTVGGNAQEAITNLTPEIDIGRVDAGNGERVKGPYLNPFPVDGHHYLVSRKGTIQLRDYQGDLCQPLIGPGSDGGFYSPRPIRPRKREELVASRLDPKPGSGDDGWATIMMQDVYHGLGDAVERGEIKELAVVQEIEKPVGVNPSLRAFGFQFPVVSCGATYAPKKIWGYAKVEEDGSANFKVPAMKPLDPLQAVEFVDRQIVGVGGGPEVFERGAVEPVMRQGGHCQRMLWLLQPTTWPA